MFERFTDRARKVMALANQEAQRLNHEYLGTEHLLLGLVKEGQGLAATVLKNLDMDPRKVRLEVEKLVKSGPDTVGMGKLGHTPRAKKVIEYAIEESRNLNHNYVGTEHLLMGLLREHEGVACQVLMNLGLKLNQVQEEVLALLGFVDDDTCSAPADLPLDAEVERLLEEAADEAQRDGAAIVRCEHVLLAMLRDPNSKVARALARLGVDEATLRAALAQEP